MGAERIAATVLSLLEVSGARRWPAPRELPIVEEVGGALSQGVFPRPGQSGLVQDDAECVMAHRFARSGPKVLAWWAREIGPYCSAHRRVALRDPCMLGVAQAGIALGAESPRPLHRIARERARLLAAAYAEHGCRGRSWSTSAS